MTDKVKTVVPSFGAFASSTLFGGSFNTFNTDTYFPGNQNSKAAGQIDPHISGYSLVFWTKLPDWVCRPFGGNANVKALLQRNFQGLDGINSITIETATTMSGFAQHEMQWVTAAGKKAVGFNTKHKEYSGGPMNLLFEHWISKVRDPDTGIATYPAEYGIEYATRNHTGECLYIQFRPDVTNVTDKGSNIEKAFYFTNVMPTIIPKDHFNYDPGSKNITEISQTWLACHHDGPKVMELAATTAKSGLGVNFVIAAEWNPTDVTKR